MAGLTTTQTFSDGDTVTAAKLNNIVSNCSIDANAVTTAKILNANVTLPKMATGSVDTDQLVNDAVQNSKLNDMAAKTVKANATNGAANPTDVPVAANKLLAGTSDSINAVSFATDLELDAADSAAADIRAADTLIHGKVRCHGSASKRHRLGLRCGRFREQTQESDCRRHDADASCFNNDQRGGSGWQPRRGR